MAADEPPRPGVNGVIAILVCGKCNTTFVGTKDNPASEQMKRHGCDIHKYPHLAAKSHGSH